jgi:hypothetical protein
LPRELIDKASQRGNEFAWRRHDLPAVFAAARHAALGNLGGQVQFRLPDATCELYWQNFDVRTRGEAEPWLAFLDRSAADVLDALARLPADDELIRDGIAHFEALRIAAAAGSDLRQALAFVCYFAAE